MGNEVSIPRLKKQEREADLLPKSGMVELYLYSSLRRYGVELY
jgi:hypothetical protein